jgi:hypothetical protein
MRPVSRANWHFITDTNDATGILIWLNMNRDAKQFCSFHQNYYVTCCGFESFSSQISNVVVSFMSDDGALSKSLLSLKSGRDCFQTRRFFSRFWKLLSFAGTLFQSMTQNFPISQRRVIRGLPFRSCIFSLHDSQPTTMMCLPGMRCIGTRTCLMSVRSLLPPRARSFAAFLAGFARHSGTLIVACDTRKKSIMRCEERRA